MARHDDSGPQQFVLEEPEPSGPVIRVRCPKCDKKLRVRAVHLGKKVRCPKCRKMVKVVPSDDAENFGELMPDASPERIQPRIIIMAIAVAAAVVAIVVWLVMRSR